MQGKDSKARLSPENKARAARGMRSALILCVFVSIIGGAADSQTATPGLHPSQLDPRQLLQQLDSVTLDPSQIYSLRNAAITRQGVRIYFNRGFVGFFKPVAGKVTGALFSGEGEVLVRPPNAAERQSMQFFTGAAILEEQFNTMYMRFTDGSAQELRNLVRPVDSQATEQPGSMAANATPLLERLDPAFSLRILEDIIGDRTRPYFHAHIQGIHLGVFEINVDARLPEPVAVEAARTKGGITYQDVWCSFRPGNPSSVLPSSFHSPARVLSYKVHTRIEQDNSLKGHAAVQLISLSGTDRAIGFDLSHRLRVTNVKDESGKNLIVFQNPFLKRSQALRFGANWLMVVLPAPYPVGQKFTLTFAYQGDVIATAGSDLLYVGAHKSWYPNLGVDPAACYDLTFRYPARLTLVATGRRMDESDADGWKNSRWVSDGPFPVAGFNLGVYKLRTLKQDGVTLEVYATHEAEAGLENRYVMTQLQSPGLTPQSRPSQFGAKPLPPPIVPLDPALLLQAVARTAAQDVRYFSGLFGTLPYSRLAISQIPGNFGQGWPELVYMPTLVFLPASMRAEMVAAESGKPLYSRLSEAHEIAHQWWGNAVGWKTYHDQWLSEGFANYAAALQLKSQKDGSRAFRQLLQSYKKDLLRRNPSGETVESGGPIWLGERLSNSLNPGGYREIVYKKASWVLQMLRFVLEDPKSHSDAPFFKALREFSQTYRGREPSTADFARMAAKYMDRSADLDHNHTLDWFFNEWVYASGIPHYHLRVSIRRLGPRRFVVGGSIKQSGIPVSFEMPVPLRAVYGKNMTQKLGRVVVTSDSGKFRFIASSRPSRVQIDDSTILAVIN